jgi:TonB family protein
MPVKTMRKTFSAFFLCCTSFFCVAAQQALTPSQLADQANAISDLSKLGSYKLKAIVAVGDEKHGATGTLTVDHDQENTRQELEFTDYHEVSLIRGDTGYFRRKPSVPLYVAERIRDFDELWWVAIPSGSEVDAVSSAKVHGVQALCFTVRPDKTTHIRYCFDAATHLLMSSRASHADDNVEILFLDYQEIDGVHFPGTIRFLEEEKAAEEVRKVAIIRMAFEPANFAPLADARGFHTCRHLVPPRPAKRVNPQYPEIARIKHLQGKVYLLAMVGEDGRVQKVTPLGGHPVLAGAAMDAVKQWEYKPATCPSGPTAIDGVVVVVQFHMGATVETRSDSGASTKSTGARVGLEAR